MDEKLIAMPSFSRRSLAVVVALAASLSTSLTLGAAPLAAANPVHLAPHIGAGTDTPTDTIDWTQCPAESDEDVAHKLPRPDVLCATVPAPVDHANPGGRTFDLHVRKITATGERTGTFFSNPGGPGSDARAVWYAALDTDDDGSAIDTVRQNHDLVTVQPRGLEGSGALECLAAPADEDDDLSVLVQQCMDTDPEFVRSITTENVVRDHELVRVTMGLERISFLGSSYGTALGMIYQTLFPASIERMILDSSVGPTGDWWYEFHQNQAEHRHEARTFVLQWIANNDATYQLGDTPLKVYRQIHELDLSEGASAARFLPPPAQAGDDAPGSVPTGSLGTGSLDVLGTGSVRLENAATASTGGFDTSPDDAKGYFTILDRFSRSPESWSDIAWVISSRIHGTLPVRTTPEELEDQIEEDEEIHTPAMTSDQSTYLRILNCNETAPPRFNPLAPALIGSSDSVGSTGEDTWALEEQTAYCPYPASTVPPRIKANRMVAQPLILQSDHDPNTPGKFGPLTAEATGGTLVRIKGTVHCHFDTGNKAVDDLVVDYLRTGEVPQGLYLDTPIPEPGPSPWP